MCSKYECLCLICPIIIENKDIYVEWPQLSAPIIVTLSEITQNFPESLYYSSRTQQIFRYPRVLQID